MKNDSHGGCNKKSDHHEVYYQIILHHIQIAYSIHMI